MRLLRGLDGGRFAGQDAVELATRADAELGEALVQVVLGSFSRVGELTTRGATTAFLEKITVVSNCASINPLSPLFVSLVMPFLCI